MKFILLLMLISCGFKGESPTPKEIDYRDLDSDGIVNSDDSRPLIADFPKIKLYRLDNMGEGLILKEKIEKIISSAHINKLKEIENSLEYEDIDEALHSRELARDNSFFSAFNYVHTSKLSNDLGFASLIPGEVIIIS